MAEEVKEDVLEIEKETVDNSETVEDTPKTFTQSEVDELIKKRLAKQEKSFDKRMQEKLDEAEKLRAMNENQKKVLPIPFWEVKEQTFWLTILGKNLMSRMDTLDG